ncbi:MAG: 50S ribosomal protein L17, partial [Candidatus Omnitrophica bacterium]|nr:50S ribosomal protein L17 [Candidatus Omnitrophota bacterium]
RTTVRTAQVVQPLAEKLISLGKSNTLSDKRRAYKILGDHKLVSVLFEDIAKRFNGINGGYTRIVRLGNRRGDNAELALFELTQIKKKEIKKPKKEAKAQAEKPEAGKEEKPVVEEKKPGVQARVQERPTAKKPSKKFLGGLRNIFKKERDSL